VLRINTLGCLAVAGDDGPVSGAAAQPRRLAILALLARAGDRGVSRSKIVAYLWPDSDEAHSRTVLSKALYALRRDLGGADVFTCGATLRLDRAVITADAIEFEEAITRGELERAASLV